MFTLVCFMGGFNYTLICFYHAYTDFFIIGFYHAYTDF